jgi:DNA replication protein DnaC
MSETRVKQQSSLTDFLPSHRVVDVETVFCEQHRTEYPAVTYRFGDRDIVVGCEQCTQEKTHHEEEQRRQKESHERQFIRIETARCAAKIPKRFSPDMACFASFEVGNDERKAKVLNGFRSYANDFAKIRLAGTSLILAGLPGTGKTHLAAALGHQLVDGGYRVQYFTAMKLFRHIRDTYSRTARQTTQAVMDQLAQFDMLIIDEIGVQRGTDDELHLLFEVIDDRYNNRAPTVLISNLTPVDLTALVGARVVDRLKDNGGKFIGFGWESFRGRGNRKES